MNAIYDEHKNVYRVNNPDGTFDTYTPEQYRALNHSEVVEEEGETDDTQDDSTHTKTLGESTELASYKLLKEIPYTDEKGEGQGVAEIGSIQEVPTELGDAWVDEGMAEKVVTDETITTEPNPQS